MATVTETEQNIGHITQVIGSTFDVEFSEQHLPAIYNAVKIQSSHKGIDLNLSGEVQQHLGGGRVEAHACGGGHDRLITRVQIAVAKIVEH